MEAFVYFLLSTLIAILLSFRPEIAEWRKSLKYQPRHRK